MDHWQLRMLRLAGAAMAIGLLWAAWKPSTGEIFDRHWSHYSAHFTVFAAFAMIWARGLPGLGAVTIASGVVGFAFAHEAVEILGHSHGFELVDACVDAVGAGVGVLLVRARYLLRHKD